MLLLPGSAAAPTFDLPPGNIPPESICNLLANPPGETINSISPDLLAVVNSLCSLPK